MSKYIHFLLILCMMSCSSASVKLVDEYYICSPDDYYDTYYLKCKLSSDTDPEIDSLHIVYWNDSTIIVGRGEKKLSWWIIKASSYTLKCCNQDTVMGPFSEHYIQKYMVKNNKTTYHKLFLDK